MHEATIPNPDLIELAAPEGMRLEQITTRGDGAIELGEAFDKANIDFSRVVDHLKVHTEGALAGSQFNSEIFNGAKDIIDFTSSWLPDTIQYDQYGRAEITAEVSDRVIGFSGVKPLSELQGKSGISLEKGQRGPGGEPDEIDGIKGAWYPETMFNKELGRPETVLDEQGNVKNPHGKFIPDVWIAKVDPEAAKEGMATDKMTIIIQKNPENNTPTVLTIFPGENTPPQPVRIDSENYKMDTLQGGPEAAYWAEHAFIETGK